MKPFHSCSTWLLYLFFIISVIYAVSYAVSSPVRYEGKSMVVEGESFQILCWLTVFDTMKWQKNGATLYSNENTQMTLSEDKSGGGIIGKLMIRKARENDTGEYTCSSFGVPGHTVVVVGDKNSKSIVANFDFDGCKVMDFKSPLVLECNLTKANISTYKVSWVKNGKSIDLTTDARIENPSPNVLVINKPQTSDVGNYSCLFSHLTTTYTLREDINVVYKPIVKLPHHASVVEGERLTLTCTIFSFPMPDIYWIIGNKTYQESEGRVKISDNAEKNKSVLQIDETTMADRNTYTCGAINLVNKMYNTTTETSALVRVKDKMAALWPFLGICAEVIILCSIILIYERKRNKTELDESDTDGSPEQKNTPDHTKESEIRHRK